MRNRDLARQKQVLDELIAKTRNATGGDVEMQSHWAKYLCVLVAGFLENALANCTGSIAEDLRALLWQISLRDL
jgi:hypothetical protein